MLHAIQLLVAPVVMISAGGLICLALYNRLSTLVARARVFHKERFEVVGRLADASMGEAERDRLNLRVKLLDEQVARILSRGRLVRKALICLMVMVLFMLGCSLSLGLTIITTSAAGLTMGLFLAGVVMMGAAMVFAMIELMRSLEPVEMEQAVLRQADAE